MASARASFSRRARASATATCATSRAWVRRGGWLLSGEEETPGFPARGGEGVGGGGGCPARPKHARTGAGGLGGGGGAPAGLEARASGGGGSGAEPHACATGRAATGRHLGGPPLLALPAPGGRPPAGDGPRVQMGEAYRLGAVAGHGGRP